MIEVAKSCYESTTPPDGMPRDCAGNGRKEDKVYKKNPGLRGLKILAYQASSMSRGPRLEIPGTLHQVIARGILPPLDKLV